MGVDLTVAPIRYLVRSSSALAYSRLAFDRDDELFDQVRKMPCFRSESPLLWYGDDGLKSELNDPYGMPLRYTQAGEFRQVKLPSPASQWNAAVIAFLAAMPADTPVYLWWH